MVVMTMMMMTMKPKFLRLMILLEYGSILEGIVCCNLLLGFILVRFLSLNKLFTNERKVFLPCTMSFISFTESPVTL